MSELKRLEDAAASVTTDAERWQIILEAWDLYYDLGCNAFDWDYDSRDLMRALYP